MNEGKRRGKEEEEKRTNISSGYYFAKYVTEDLLVNSAYCGRDLCC